MDESFAAIGQAKGVATAALIPFISVKEQQTIVERLDTLQAETKRLERHYERQLGDMKELKKSSLERAFRREL